MGGNYVLGIASVLLARIGNEEVVKILSQVLDDLVAGKISNKRLRVLCWHEILDR